MAKIYKKDFFKNKNKLIKFEVSINLENILDIHEFVRLFKVSWGKDNTSWAMLLVHFKS